MSLSTSLEDTLSAMKGLFRSRFGIGRLGSWDKESDVDDSMVSEDHPLFPESSDLDIGIGEYLSLEEDDSEESSTPGAIKTRNEVPKNNAALNLTAKTCRNKGKWGKGKTFSLPNYSKYG
jgi:hypothetical protein